MISPKKLRTGIITSYLLLVVICIGNYSCQSLGFKSLRKEPTKLFLPKPDLEDWDEDIMLGAPSTGPIENSQTIELPPNPNDFVQSMPPETVSENPENQPRFVGSPRVRQTQTPTEPQLPNEPAVKTYEEFMVILDVEREISTNKSGHARVWIGKENYMPQSREDFVRDSGKSPASIGDFVRITLIAPDFDIQPSNFECVRIHSSGSSVSFTITPKQRGEFKVSALVEFFESNYCEGVGIPKSSDLLTIKVSVDGNHILWSKASELGSIFWDKFVSFWGGLLTLMFAALMYFLRKHLKKKTGFEELNRENDPT